MKNKNYFSVYAERKHNLLRYLAFENKPSGIFVKIKKMLVVSFLIITGIVNKGLSQQFFAGDGSALNAAKWAPSCGGSYTSTFTAGTTANFCVVSGTGVGPTANMSFAAINATENFTLSSPANSLNNLSNGVITVTVSSSKVLDFGSQATTGAIAAGYIKNGAGAWALVGNSYNGGFTLNAGTLIARGVNAMGTASTLTINGGTIGANAASNFTGKYPLGIIIGGNFTLGSGVGASVNTADLTFSNDVSLGAATRTITIGGTGLYTFGGIISGSSGTGLTVAGSGGTILLTGSSTYNGLTTVSGGTLQLGHATATLPATNNVTVNSGAVLEIINNQTLNNITINSGGTLLIDAAAKLTITGTITNAGAITVDGTLVMGTSQITGAGSVTVNGTIKTSNANGFSGAANTTIATGGSFTLATTSTVEYNSGSAQTITAGNYALLLSSGAGNRTLAPSGTINISDDFSVTGTGLFTVTNSTVNFTQAPAAATTYVVPALSPAVSGGPNYYNLTISTSNAGGGVPTTTLGNLKVGNDFTENSTSGIVRVTNGATRTFNVQGDFTLSSGTFYIVHTGGNAGAVGTVNVSGNYTQSGGTLGVNLAPTTATGALNITLDYLQTGGSLALIASANCGNATVTVDGSTTVSTTLTNGIYLEFVDNVTSTGIFQANGNATFSGTAVPLVNWGTGTITGNAFKIKGNFSKSGTGTFVTTSTTTSADGFVFNGTGTQALPQTLTYSGATSNKTNYAVNSTTAVKLLSGLTVGTNSTFIVNNGILDFDTRTISGAGSFQTDVNSTLITANTNGIYFGTTGSVSNAIGSVFLLTGTSYIFNGASAQTTHFKSNPNPQQLTNLTVNNSNGITLTEGVTIDGVLTFTSGKINNPSPFQVLFNSTATTTGAGPGKYITGTGTIRTNVDLGNTSKLIPIGDALYGGVFLTFTSGASASGFINTTVAATDANEGANLSGINQSQKVNRYWFLTGTPAALGTYDITLNFESGNVTGGSPANFVIRKFSSGAWAPTTLAVGGALATSTKATGLTSFSDFEVGEKNTVVAGSNPSSDTKCVNGTATFTTTASASLPTPTIKWQEKVGAGPFNDITDAGIYSGSATTTLTIAGVTIGMNGNQYRADFRNINSPAGTTSTTAATLTVNSPSTAPTGISGTTTLCSGDPTTLTASGGILGTGANYQWGTGGTPGVNPLSGETASTLNVSPISNITYWVRIENTAAPCTGATSGVTQLVTVNSSSTAPTGISGTTTLCSGDPTTLTATGGTPGTGANYQWGTGAIVGTSPLIGETASTLNVSPTGNVTYWVRIENTAAPCTGATSGVTQLVTVNSSSTAPTGISGTTTLCSGDPTTLTATGGTLGTGANYQWGTGAIVGISPLIGETASTLNVSPTGNVTYWVRIENTAAPCTGATSGVTQLVTVNSSSTAPTGISGTTTTCSGDPIILTATGGTLGTGANYQWGTGGTPGVNPLSGETASTLNVSPISNVTYWVRIENTAAPCTGATNGVTQLVTVNSPSTAPTGISGTTTLCSGDPTTLTATGGTLGTGANYQWGTGGTPGVNPLSGQTASTLNVSPTSNTTYWVWIENTTAPCTGATSGVTQLVTVNQASIAPTGISGTTTLCSGDPTTLTATGGTLGTGANYQWGTGGTPGVNPLSGQTASTLNVSPTSNTTYWVWIENTAAPCTGATSGVTQIVTVNTLSTAPTSVTSNDPDNEICSSSSILLTANGGVLGSSPGTSYKWYEGGCGTGSVLGSASTLNVITPTAGSHTYYVRIEDVCGNTSCSSITILVTSGPPGIVTGGFTAPAAACSGTTSLISVTPVGGSNIHYSWNVGSNSSTVLFSTTNGPPWSPGPFNTTTNQVWVQFGAIGAGQSGYYVCVQGVNACASTINRCIWIRGTVNGPGPITPASGVVACENTTQVYSCGLSSGATIYTWTLNGLTAPITPNGGNNPTNVSVAFPNGFTTGQLCVTAALSCGGVSTSPPRCMTINKNPANPNVPTGASAACPGTTLPYSIPAVPGASGYSWTVPANATIATGANSPSITVNFPTPFTGSSSVCVTATSGCGASVVKCKTVVSGIPNQPAGITGPLTNICGSTVQYSVVAPPGGLIYTWTNPPGTTISGLATGSTILLNVSPTFTSGFLTVVANSALCPPSTSASRTSSTFWGRPNIPGAITAFPTVWCSGQSVNFSVTNPLTGPVPSYTWTSSNGTITSLQGPNNIDVTWGTNGPGTITARASNGCGLSAGTSSQSFSSGCREEGINTSSAVFSTYPNPAHDKITVSIDVNEQTGFNLKLRDMSGRIILSEDRQAEEGLNAYNMNLKGFAKGIYMLEVVSANDRWKTKVIIE